MRFWREGQGLVAVAAGGSSARGSGFEVAEGLGGGRRDRRSISSFVEPHLKLMVRRRSA